MKLIWICSLTTCFQLLVAGRTGAQSPNSGQIIKRPDVKLLGQFPSRVRVSETGDPTKLQVVASIATGKNGLAVRYDDVSLRILGEDGNEIGVARKSAATTHFIDVSGTKNGIYEVSVANNQKITAVVLTFGGFTQEFRITEVLKPIPGPP